MNNRRFSLLIPWFMDGATALIFATVPLLALRFHADAMLLGAMGWIPQAVRLPICFTSGHLSEKYGRVKLIVPAACAVALAGVGLANTHSNAFILVYSILAVAAIGSFYPPLQAMVSDKSGRGELTKNLGAFNIGWCLGGAAMAMSVRWLVLYGLHNIFYLAAIGAVVAAALVILWARRGSSLPSQAAADDTPFPEYPSYLLLIARLGHFTGFFGLAIIRFLFPQLGHNLGWSESSVATITGLAVAGQGVGMLITNTGPWWRGKLWPQLMAQGMLLTCGITITLVSSPVLIGAAAFVLGTALSVAYTAALYHGLAARKSKGRNAGLHEALVAAGSIAGCLLGGLAAQHISLRAPYVLIALAAIACLVTTAVVYRNRPESCA